MRSRERSLSGALVPKTGVRFLIGILGFFGVVVFSYLLYGFLGYMTTSARQPYCRESPMGAEACPLDYAMAAADLLLIWMHLMAVYVLPLVLITALVIALGQWIDSRPSSRSRT